MEQPKNLQQIAKEKAQAQMPNAPTPAPTVPNVEAEGMEKLNALPSNHIMNVIRSLKENQTRPTVWFDFELPSNGKCGYPKDIKLRELTTEDEKILIKEMFASKDNSLLDVIKKCAKFETMPNFDFENLTNFDQDFIIIELSAITFPGEKDITITDDKNHKIGIKLNKEDLSFTPVSADLEYPLKVVLPSTKIEWYLNFITLKKVKEIDKAVKSLSADVLTRLLVSIALSTEKIEKNNQPITSENFYELVKLLDSLPPTDLKKIIDSYNEMSEAYGYKLTKDYYCTECGKGGQMELEPLNFFRITI